MAEKKTPKPEPEAVVADDVSAQTPSGLAAAAAGDLADDASDEEKVAAGDRATEAYLKARRG